MSIEKEENQNPDLNKYLYILLAASFLIRAFIAGFIELGNDEVYYWTYAKFPALSHFDHPPMVGWFIQLFSLDLLFSSEFFIRLSSIVFGTINTYLIFKLGKKLKDENAGFVSALLYTASIYCFVITGVFILPDTPLLLFWLLSLYLLADVLKDKQASKQSRKKLLIAGLTIGLAILSKYHALYLWGATGLIIIFFNRYWLKTKELYISVFITLIVIFPVILWNYQNEFISFTFQGERVNVAGNVIKWNSLLTELSGQILYNNPVNFLIFIWVLISLFGKNKWTDPFQKNFLLIFSLPLIFIFLFFSTFRDTLPHWTGPGYLCLILLAGVYFSAKKKIFPWITKLSLLILLFVVSLGVMQINYGIIKVKEDPTLDMYGWDQLRQGFAGKYKRAVSDNKISKDFVLISYRWFPAAHLDYYVAEPLGIKLYVAGTLERMHKYAWINDLRGKPSLHSDAYFIFPSNDHKDPNEVAPAFYSRYFLDDSIPVYRSQQIVKYYYLYIFKDYNGKDFLKKE
jgi:hypothetical protein